MKRGDCLRKYKKRIWFLTGILIFILISIIVGIVQYNKDLPKDISYESPIYKTNDLQFVYDLTYQHQDERVMEQNLMQEALRIIDNAQQLLLIDMFLYNDDYDREKGTYPNSAQQITDALINKRLSNPALPISVITDSMNTLYGSNDSIFFEELKKHDIQVIITNMKPMRDSNPIYSSIWRPYLQWWKPSQNGFLPNAFNPDGGKASVGSYLDLLNFKANHRKIVMNESQALITSANLTHDGSSFHSNIGFVVQGGILTDLYESEKAVAELSDVSLPDATFESDTTEGELEVKLITEGKIKDAMLQALTAANEHSTVKIGVFYISDRDIVKALKDAAARGASIQMILDPNKDAFGIEKNGIPNRQVAAELMKEENIEIRWYDTNGEQYHSKFLMVDYESETILIGGSANFTRRNLADYNLETNLHIKMPATHNVSKEVHTYFERLWTNEDGIYTVEFEQYEDQSLWKKVFYRFQEWTGLSTF